MPLRDHVAADDAPLGWESLAIADHLAEAAGDGVSLSYLRSHFTQYAADKIEALKRHGWVIAEDHSLDGDGRVFVLVVDPRDRVAA